MDIRCEHKLFGRLVEPSVVEVKCSSRFCGARVGVVVLHRFSATDGTLLETKRYRDTPKLERNNHGSR